MANTLKFGLGQWVTKKGSTLAYNDENGNFKPLPFDFSRSTSATRVNKDGLIEVVTNNKPRIDFLNDSNGALLLEPSRTNLITYSEDFSNGSWTKTNASVLSDQVVSPDGTSNADKLVENTANSVHQISLFKSASVNDYSFSVFVKKGEREFVSLVFSDNVRYLVHYTFDLTNGVVTKNYNYTGVTSVFTSKSIGNGWYKLTLSSNYTWATLIYPRIYIENTSTPPTVPSNTYIGDGTSGLYIWGAQLEQGSYPTSYIPTQGATATKVAETCNGAGYVNTFNSIEGVLKVNVSVLLSESSIKQISINDGSPSNRILIYISSNAVIARLIKAGIIEINLIAGVTDSTEINEISFKYKSGDFGLKINNVEIDTDTTSVSLGASTLTTLSFDNGEGGSAFYGRTSNIKVFNDITNY